MKFFEFLEELFLEKIPEILMDLVGYVLDIISIILTKIANFILKLLGSSFDEVEQFTFDIVGQIENLWNSLPYEAIQLLTVLHVVDGLTIILSALLIRFILKIIPFVG